MKKRIFSELHHPVDLPTDQSQGYHWQNQNKDWWENNPMRYDWKDNLDCEEFSVEYFEEIDRRFFSEVSKYMPWKEKPFDQLIDFSALGNMDVLEIGVGSGSHAQLISTYAKTFTGIDITEYAAKSASQRLQQLNINASIIQMDAEKMDFPDSSFDFVWSWGCIHHSSDTYQILKEIHRVLRPGGKAVIMVYHRSWWAYYVIAGFFHGIIRGKLFKLKTLCNVLQDSTDGALARFYTIREWEDLVAPMFNVESLIFGSKPVLFPLPASKFKHLLMSIFPSSLSRLFLNRFKMGTFLVSYLYKI